MLNAKGLKIAIVTAKFNSFVTKKLTQGAIDALKMLNINSEDIFTYSVPGAFELGVLTEKIASTKKYDAIICNGAVIRGETPHFNQVVNACTSSLSNIAVKYQIPIAYGVLTTDTVEQAINRAGLKLGNKGYEAAFTAVEMANIFKKFD